MAIRPGFDHNSLYEAGWGVIFPSRQDPTLRGALRDALMPLLKQRMRLAGERYRELDYDPGESVQKFLNRYGATPGLVDPMRIPYYLLILAAPGVIPYEFQTALGANYAVGRVWFDDFGQLNSYAQNVVRTEQNKVQREPRMVLFAPAIPGDFASNYMAGNLIKPLYGLLSRRSEWKVELVSAAEATRANLSRMVNQHAPRLLVTAGPGITFPPGNPRQIDEQGALICQDWPGALTWRGEIPSDFTFTAKDISDGADLRGTIFFQIGDYSLGTPQFSQAQKDLYEEAPRLAEAPFTASLPQRLISLPGKGALAVTGLVDRFWTVAIPDLQIPSATTLAIYESSLRRLMEGASLGYALEFFRQRTLELSVDMTGLQEEIQFGKEVNPQQLVATWTMMSDARNLSIFGDPAVRL